METESLRARALRLWRERAEEFDARRRAHELEQEAVREAELREYRLERARLYEVDWPQALTVIWPSSDAPTEPIGATAEFDHLAQALAYMLPRRNDAVIEAAVRFLEADPWFFNSGYRKQAIIRRLTQRALSAEHVRRLRSVVLRRIESNRGQGLRYYCRLARKVDSPEFREALRRKLDHPDPAARRRAAWILESLDSPHVTPPSGARLSRDSPYLT